jgi:hypothetical protein
MSPKVVLACAALIVLVIVGGALLAGRMNLIAESSERTSTFCHTVRVGDTVAETVERAETGSSRLGSPGGMEGVTPTAAVHAAGLNVIVEDHGSDDSWPRYVIWTGPQYERIYCSIEVTDDGKVKAIHLGRIDGPGPPPGFLEDWFDEWM